MGKEIIAVTGGTGFVGRHLINRLQETETKVRILTRHNSDDIGVDESVVGNLETGENLDKFLEGTDTVINLVGRFQPPFRDQVTGNVLILENLCSSAVKAGVKKLIHISALAVYGLPQDEHLFMEKDIPKPDTSYALSKRLGEEVIEFYQRNFGFPSIILRPPNVYGPGSDHGVVYSFIKSAKETGGVTIHGDGTQQRDFLYVGDLVDAIVKCLGYGSSDIFNISTSDPKDLNELVKVLSKVMETDLKIIYEGEAQGAKVVSAYNSKAKDILNWKPRTSIEEGLALTLI